MPAPGMEAGGIRSKSILHRATEVESLAETDGSSAQEAAEYFKDPYFDVFVGGSAGDVNVGTAGFFRQARETVIGCSSSRMAGKN